MGYFKNIIISVCLDKGMSQEQAEYVEENGNYDLIHFRDFGIQDKVGAFIVYLDMKGQFDHFSYIFKYVDFDKWYSDFVDSGGFIEKIHSNCYLIVW